MNLNFSKDADNIADHLTEAKVVGCDSPYRHRYVTIPNVICVARILGSLLLLMLAIQGYATAFVVGFVILHFSDWVDGKLARWLNQRSDFGARLDSASDSILYASLIFGSLILKWEELQSEIPWLLMPLASYAVTTGYGLWKYGRIPSYHTYGAKFSQWLVLAGALAMLLDWSMWPMRIAATAVTLTNLEATAITFVLSTWRADVLTIRHVMKGRQQKTD